MQASSLQLQSGEKVSAEPRQAGRIDGLDALRAVSAILVVLLHASIPYMLAPFPGLAWPVHDAHPSGWVDAVGWWVDSFVMPVFLLMAGFSAAELLRRRGLDRFLKHRSRRILGPLALGMAVLLPIELYLWLLAWVGQGEIQAVKLRSLKIDSPHGDHLWGLSHLWFLEYLFLYSLAAWCFARLFQRTVREDDASLGQPANRIALHHPIRDNSHGSTRSLSDGSVLFAISILGGLICGGFMCWHPRVLIGFSHGWFPHPANFLCFGLVFAAGWWLAGRHRNGHDVAVGCELQAAVGLILFIAALPGVREFAALRDTDARIDWSTAMLFGLAGWLSAVGWWGMFLKHFNRRPAAWVRYLAEASFWLYLVHHPVVALLQVNLSFVSWPSGLKFVIVSLSAIALSLIMYETLVRHTRLGVLLNGRRPSTKAIPPSTDTTPIAEPSRRAA